MLPTEVFDITQLYLDLRNPRYPRSSSTNTGAAFETTSEAINQLCAKDKILSLAKDIVRFGLNPMDSLGLLKDKNDTYIVAEGNRRLCALMLCHDPELAPTALREEFNILKQNFVIPTKLKGVVFNERDEVNIWLFRMHTNSQEGIGRRKWDTRQIAEFDENSSHKLSIALIDYAVNRNLVEATKLKSSLSTLTPYISSKALRKLFAINELDNGNFTTLLSKGSFDTLLRLFLGDISEGKRNTRSPRNDEGYEIYAGELLSRMPAAPVQNQNPTTIRSASTLTPLQSKLEPAPKTGKTQNFDPSKLDKIPVNDDINEKLELIGNYKLRALYSNISQLSTAKYCVILHVGIWSFLEVVTALHGRVSPDFRSYINSAQLLKMGIENPKDINKTLTQLQDNGNATKHSIEVTSFNGAQIVHHFRIIEPVILKLLDDIIDQKSLNT